MTTPTIDSVPVAKTPPGGSDEWPSAILAGCIEPLPSGAPDLAGFWQTIEVEVNGEVVPGHKNIGHVQRIEQAGDRLVVTGGSIIHDMRCDGTLDNGVHDVAEFDLKTEIHVVASYEHAVHVLRPQGLDIEVRRWRDGEHLLWQYLGFTSRLQRIASADADPTAVFAQLEAS